MNFLYKTFRNCIKSSHFKGIDKHDLSTLLFLSIESIMVYERAYPILMENLNRLKIEHGHRSM